MQSKGHLYKNKSSGGIFGSILIDTKKGMVFALLRFPVCWTASYIGYGLGYIWYSLDSIIFSSVRAV